MKTTHRQSSLGIALCALASACGAPQSASLSGHLDNGTFALDNPVVIATSTSGARYVSYVHPDLSFAITVPVAETYSLSLANSTRGGEFRVLSHIDIATAGGPSRYVTLDGAVVAELGAVRPIDWNATTMGTGLSTTSAPASNPGAAHASGQGKGGDDGNDCKPDPVTACDPTSVMESQTEHEIDGSAQGVGGQAQALGAGEVKVTICHIPPGNPGNAHTITVGAPAVPAHLAHGDYLGACLPSTTPPEPPCLPSGGDSSTDGGVSPPSNGGGGTSTGGGPGATCVINVDCVTGFVCLQSSCGPVVL